VTLGISPPTYKISDLTELAAEMMNFHVTPVEAVTREFVAVILAGFGNE
jgi:hypothetical protein